MWIGRIKVGILQPIDKPIFLKALGVCKERSFFGDSDKHHAISLLHDLTF